MVARRRVQTRNPMHRSHEYLAKIAIEVTDAVFIHQVLGALKPATFPPRYAPMPSRR